MTAIHSARSTVLIDGFDLGCFFDDVSFEASQAMNNRTALCHSAENFVPGIKSGKVTGATFVDDTVTTGSLAVLLARYGVTPGGGTPAAFTKSHGLAAVGALADLAYLNTTNLALKDIFNDLQKLTLNGSSAANAVDFGRWLHTLSGETTFPFSGTAVDNLASSANGGVGVAHCTTIAGASPNAVIKIQHSTTGVGSWVDLISFTAITAANSVRRVEVTGTVNRYLRETITDAGTTTSITAGVAFARR